VLGVGDVAHAGHEVHREEDPGQDQHDEAVEGDLTEQEGPVVGEHLAGELPYGVADAGAPVQVVRCRGRAVGGLSGGGAHRSRSQKLGPIGSWKSERATRYPSVSTVIGSCGRARLAGPKTTLASSARSK